MRKLVLVGSAITMLIVAPLLAASTGNAQSRKNTGSNYGYCKSGQKVQDMKSCKENGGTQ